MMSVHAETTSPATNPIDLVEEIVLANEWAHDRANDEEMVVEVTGRWCDYRLYFVWQDEISAMHFSCGFDMKVPKGRKAAVYELLALEDDAKPAALAVYARSRGIVLSDDVIEYLLRHGRRDMPSLLATLAALDRHSLATKRPITVPLLKGWLQRELEWKPAAADTLRNA